MLRYIRQRSEFCWDYKEEGWKTGGIGKGVGAKEESANMGSTTEVVMDDMSVEQNPTPSMVFKLASELITDCDGHCFQAI